MEGKTQTIGAYTQITSSSLFPIILIQRAQGEKEKDGAWVATVGQVRRRPCATKALVLTCVISSNDSMVRYRSSH